LSEQGKNTPGPWQTLPEEVDRDYIRVRGTRIGCKYKIANVPHTIIPGQTYGVDETRADARLIAAAPDLLAALEALTPILEAAESNASGNPEWFWVSPRINAAREAIAKAKGDA